jgi:RNA polymerase sigma-70 factor, ECF subfamily
MDRWSAKFCERFRHGDRAVIEEVYWAYLSLVEHVLTAGFWLKGRAIPVPGVRDADQRADLVQEVFVRAFSDAARQSFDAALDYRSYLLGISRNLLIDHHRRTRNRPLVFDFQLDRPHDDLPGPDALTWQSSALIAIVEVYVAGLKSPLRELYYTRFVLGRSQREAADGLGLSRQNVRTLEERVKAGLRTALRRARHTQRSVRAALEDTRFLQDADARTS